MNFDHDAGLIDSLLTIDTTITPPLGGVIANSLIVIGNGAVRLPNGTTAERPAGATGWVRVNNTLQQLEAYINGAWTVCSLNNELTALSALATTGMIARTGTATYTPRTIAGTASNISVTNGDGVAGAPTIDLINAGSVISNQFVKITTDAKGRVTGSNAVAAGDITALVDGTYVNIAGDSMTSGADITFSGGGEVLGLPATPSGPTAAVSAAYLDARVQGLTPKAVVRAATTASGTLASSFANASVIDGVTLATNDRILIKNQAAPAENGIYTVNASGAPTRAVDMDLWTEIPNAYTFVSEGTTLADTGWVCSANTGGTLNTTAITWIQFASAGVYTAGTGITVTGTVISLTAPVTMALGGTNNASLAASNGGIVYSDASKLMMLAGTASAGQMLRSGATAAPTWSTATWPATTTAGQLLYSSAANVVGGLALGTANQVLGMNNGATAPEYKTITQGTGITVTHGAGTVTIAATALALSLVKENPSAPTTPTVGGTNAVAIGSGSAATANQSLAIGDGSVTRLVGETVLANGEFATPGDCQNGKIILRAITANATPTELFTDGTSARLALANNSCVAFVAIVTARRTDTTGGAAGYLVRGVIRRDANAAATALVGSPSVETLGETNTSWGVAATADTTNGSLKFSVTGEAAKTVRWGAAVEFMEITN